MFWSQLVQLCVLQVCELRAGLGRGLHTFTYEKEATQNKEVPQAFLRGGGRARSQTKLWL